LWNDVRSFASTDLILFAEYLQQRLALIELNSEADLGTFIMFGRTGAPQKGGSHTPANVGQQHAWGGSVRRIAKSELHDVA